MVFGREMGSKSRESGFRACMQLPIPACSAASSVVAPVTVSRESVTSRDVM